MFEKSLSARQFEELRIAKERRTPTELASGASVSVAQTADVQPVESATTVDIQSAVEAKVLASDKISFS